MNLASLASFRVFGRILGRGSAAGLQLGLAAAAANLPSETADFFRQLVQPIFREHCHTCHSHQAEKIQGDLLLDSAAAFAAGGAHGAVVVPGKPDASRLIVAIQRHDPDLQMPPKGPPVPPEQIAILVEWVRRGAVWPEESTAKFGAAVKSRARGLITEEDRRWWAFQALQEKPIPADDSGWSRQPLDRFVIERMRREGLSPSPPAEPNAFIRRLTFDLIGLPPTPAEVEAFLADCAAENRRRPSANPLPAAAVEHLADRLLASPQYGEGAARHWLDLVRYAESDGYRVDDYRPHAWRYRDWVVRAFNDDLPYDRFVQAQLAGDELWPQDPQLSRVATSFLRHGIYEYNNRDARGQWQTILNELTDLTSDVFLGLGLQCARCHDHKFDPLLQRDYFRWQAFFAPIEFRQDLAVATAEEELAYAARMAEWSELTGELRAEIAALEAPYRVRAAAEIIAKFPPDVQKLLREEPVNRPVAEEQIARLAYRQVRYEYDRLASKFTPADKAAIEAVQKRLREYEPLKPDPLPTAFTITDIGPVAPPTRLPRAKDGPPLEPGFPTVIEANSGTIAPPPGVTNSTGRRATLALWLTSPTNSLAARVVVNRAWQQHFARGIVATSSDFGHLGEPPTHPELMDWLAGRFVAEGWSLKRLHRTIVTSATYAQSALGRGTTTKDPENRWVSRFPTKRLEAEQIRDAQLAVTGELRLDASGPSEPSTQPRRTIYTRITRNVRDPLLDVFDAPENFTSTAQRNVTTTPTQALLLLNGPGLLDRARAFARRLIREAGADEDRRIRLAYQLAFGRNPRPQEQAAALGFLEAQRRRIPAGKPKDASFAAEKMPYREGRAALLSPKSAQSRFSVPANDTLPTGDFTFEAFALLRSPPERDGFRTLAAQWDGQPAHPGWALAVAGGAMTPKPQTLVLRLGTTNGTAGEILTSGVPLELNKPYFVAVIVRAAERGDDAVTFFIKDVSNDCEPMQTIRSRRTFTEPIRSVTGLALGALTGKAVESPWDGLLDDVRFSRGALAGEQLLVQNEILPPGCVGWWRFESTPGSYQDLSPCKNDLTLSSTLKLETLDPGTQALADLCHVLLNANEFLYTD